MTSSATTRLQRRSVVQFVGCLFYVLLSALFKDALMFEFCVSSVTGELVWNSGEIILAGGSASAGREDLSATNSTLVWD